MDNMYSSSDNDDHLIDHVVSWQDSDRKIGSDDEDIGLDEDSLPLDAGYVSYSESDDKRDTDTESDCDLDLTLLQNVSGHLHSLILNPFFLLCCCLYCPCHSICLYIYSLALIFYNHRNKSNLSLMMKTHLI